MTPLAGSFSSDVPYDSLSIICRVDSVAEPDYCLLKGDAILLVVLQRRSSLDDPEPHIIAAAEFNYHIIIWWFCS